MVRKAYQRKFPYESFGRLLYLWGNVLHWRLPPMKKPIKCCLSCPGRISELCRGRKESRLREVGKSRTPIYYFKKEGGGR